MTSGIGLSQRTVLSLHSYLFVMKYSHPDTDPAANAMVSVCFYLLKISNSFKIGDQITDSIEVYMLCTILEFMQQ